MGYLDDPARIMMSYNGKEVESEIKLMRLHFYDPSTDGEIKVFSLINPESEAIRDLS